MKHVITPQRRGTFLDQFAAHERRVVVELFTDAADGAIDPSEVIAGVRRLIQKRCSSTALEGDEAELRQAQGLREALLGALNRDPAAAVEFAVLVMRRRVAR